MNVEFAMLPTAGKYEQSCIVTGVDEQGDRREICTLKIVGIVEAPVEISRTSIMPSDIANGSLTVDLTAVSEVQVQWEALSLLSIGQTIDVESNAKAAQVKFVFPEKKLDSQSVVLQVPIKWQERQYVYSIPLVVVNELLTITPTVPVFRMHDDSNPPVCTAKIVVKGNGIRLSKDGMRFFLATDSSADDMMDLSRIDQSKLNVRMIGTTTAVVEITFSPAKVDKRFKCLRIESDNVANRTVEFTFN